METIRAYLYVIVSGVGLLTAVVFTALQWGNRSTFSAFGPNVTVRTIYLVAASAVGGVVFYGLCRLMVQGTRVLWKRRREQARIADEVKRQDNRPRA